MGLTQVLEKEAPAALPSWGHCLLVSLHLRFTCLQDLVLDGQETGAVGALGQI